MADFNEPAEALSLRKRISHGDALPSGDFGVDKLSSHSAGGPGQNEAAGTLPDAKRNAPHGGNQANPDHGEFK